MAPLPDQRASSKPDRPNTLSGIKAKRHELAKYRDQLEADIKAVTVDIDHLDAAIRIFDPEDTPEARKRYAALHRAPKGQSTRFVLARLREASEPLTSRQLADAWCADRGLTAKPSTVSLVRKRIGATLKALHHKGTVRQDGHAEGLIRWRLA
ncbi:MAG: hypothetical protein E7812_18745 [Phenylobacterium sp.]|nr:MAG: hypothetical protein E7812_18745 [Phenylobacterium sp.]